MKASEVLPSVRLRLDAVFGSRLKRIVMYGSQARGEAEADSDIDIMVLLDEPVRFGSDLETITRVLYPLQLEIPDRPLHAIPVSEKAYQAGEFAVYRAAQQEGVLL